MPTLDTGSKKIKFAYTTKGISQAKKLLDMEFKEYQAKKRGLTISIRKKRKAMKRRKKK